MLTYLFPSTTLIGSGFEKLLSQPPLYGFIDLTTRKESSCYWKTTPSALVLVLYQTRPLAVGLALSFSHRLLLYI